MAATTRGIMLCSVAVVLIAATSSPGWAQGTGQKGAPPVGERPKSVTSARTPVTPSPATPLVKKFLIVQMPTINGGTPFDRRYMPEVRLPRGNPALDSPWMNQVILARGPVVVNVIPHSLSSGWEEPFVPRPNAWQSVRNPFAVNPLLMNPLQLNRPLFDSFNGPGLFVGGMGIPPRGDNLADARKPGSLLDEAPEYPAGSGSTTIYQPISGIVTLADGTTFYRGAGSDMATELGNYSGGGGLDSSLFGGNFFSPGLGSVGTVGEWNGFLPYVW
jgi:hypothetical protein